MVSHRVKVVIQAMMAIVIVVLGYWLYQSIKAPWAEVERRAEVERLTRARMAQVRTALISYERQEGRFPGGLDSLVMWVAQDSIIGMNPDSVFGEDGFNLDSLIFSPRTGSEFMYTLNNTGQVAIYFLEDPDSEDHIGSSEPDVTSLNAASWE